VIPQQRFFERRNSKEDAKACVDVESDVVARLSPRLGKYIGTD
jgi:hypothetical protein